jgi:hypothetical protein
VARIQLTPCRREQSRLPTNEIRHANRWTLLDEHSRAFSCRCEIRHAECDRRDSKPTPRHRQKAPNTWFSGPAQRPLDAPNTLVARAPLQPVVMLHVRVNGLAGATG